MGRVVRNNWLAWMGLVALLTAPFAVYSQEKMHSHHHGVAMAPTAEEAAAPPALQTARVTSAAFDHKGRLWLVWAHGGHLYVNHSDDLGRSFSAPVRVNRAPEKINQNGESRPLIAADGEGHLYVAWSEALPKRFTGNIRFSRSLDGGRHFSEPLIVNDNREMIGHSFVSMVVDDQGVVQLVWLDSRDSSDAKRRNIPYEGSSLYYARSTDHGASFSVNRKLADHTCQCCRIAIALDREQHPVVMWRELFPNAEGKPSRDHAVIRVDGEGRGVGMERVSFENWQVESCPHHGPTLAIAGGGRYHMAWFSHEHEQPGLYYAWSDDQGKTTSPVYRFGGDDDQAQHPWLLVARGGLYLAWKSFDGEQSHILVMVSRDRGQSWGKPVVIASSAAESDHPFLLQRQGRVYLSWQTQERGYRLVEITGAVK